MSDFAFVRYSNELALEIPLDPAAFVRVCTMHHAGRVAARANAETLTAEHVEQSFNPVRG